MNGFRQMVVSSELFNTATCKYQEIKADVLNSCLYFLQRIRQRISVKGIVLIFLWNYETNLCKESVIYLH